MSLMQKNLRSDVQFSNYEAFNFGNHSVAVLIPRNKKFRFCDLLLSKR